MMAQVRVSYSGVNGAEILGHWGGVSVPLT